MAGNDYFSIVNESGAKTLHGKNGFAASHVANMLKTVIYVGDRHLQQQAPANYMTHKPDYSKPYTSKYIKNDHEGIVDRRLWDAVQNRRKEIEEKKQAGINVKSSSHFLYGKVFCADCGSPMNEETMAEANIRIELTGRTAKVVKAEKAA